MQYNDKGILLIAVGSNQYGRMAANLASSIRAIDANIKIHLVWSGESISHLTDKHKELFTSMSECPKEYYTKGEKSVYIKPKLFMYELSPFKETLFLDSDVILISDNTFKNPSTIFDELKDVELTFQNRDFFDLSKEEINEGYSFWCNVKDVKEKYFAGGFKNGTGKYYSLHSEFVYFNRSDSNAKFFKLAQQIFDKPLVKGKEWGGDLPDELAFAIAMAITGKYPHKDKYLPLFWFAAEKQIPLSQIRSNYYGISIGGHILPERIKGEYESLAKVYAKMMNLPYHFPVFAKKTWAKERASM